MKLIQIKLGKAMNTLKREGVIRGGERVLRALFAPFKKVGHGDILIITGGVGDSARYRAHHVEEELKLHDFKCAVAIQGNPFLSGYADKFQVFIFHRILFTPGIAKFIAKIKGLGKEIIFETDDLVFDPQYLENMDYFKKMNYFEKKLYENGVGGEILKDPYVKTCTTTTSYLADKLRRYNKQVFLVPNRLSGDDLEMADKILKTQKKKDANSIRIGYFSGTISHNKDFATITEALMSIMEKYAQVELFLVGPLEIDNALNKFQNRIRQLPYVPRDKHFENIWYVDINLVPLEIGNPFCESKSELKFFEAGILGIPTVAVRNQTFGEAISDGADGFLAGETEEWIEKIGRLVENDDLRRAMGEEARQKCLKRYTNKNSDNKEYYNYLKSKI